MAKANILGVLLDLVTLDEVLAYLEQVVQNGQRALVAHAHVMGLNLAYEQAWFREFLNRADLVYCDGMGVRLGGRILGHTVPQRFTLADWMGALAGMACRQHFSLYFLGNPPGVAQRAAEKLRQSYPGLEIVGTHHGHFDKTVASAENQAVLRQINAARPDILLVGMGMPIQERWLLENWASVQANVALTGGAIFEYVSGDLKRGPRWMTDHYLEWLARLCISPRRYTWRYLRDNPLFLYRILHQKYAR
jgi:N-acetylglucosaminyldiphosphoundecaprenol N-acetyl-beta-D-mannosaminyltransferase